MAGDELNINLDSSDEEEVVSLVDEALRVTEEEAFYGTVPGSTLATSIALSLTSAQGNPTVERGPPRRRRRRHRRQRRSHFRPERFSMQAQITLVIILIALAIIRRSAAQLDRNVDVVSPQDHPRPGSVVPLSDSPGDFFPDRASEKSRILARDEAVVYHGEFVPNSLSSSFKKSTNSDIMLSNKTHTDLYCSDDVTLSEAITMYRRPNRNNEHHTVNGHINMPVLHAMAGNVAVTWPHSRFNPPFTFIADSFQNRPYFSYAHRFTCSYKFDKHLVLIRQRTFGFKWNHTYALNITDHAVFTPIFGMSNYKPQMYNGVIRDTAPSLRGSFYTPLTEEYGRDCYIMNDQFSMCANLTSDQATSYNFAYLDMVFRRETGILRDPVLGARIVRTGLEVLCSWSGGCIFHAATRRFNVPFSSRCWQCCLRSITDGRRIPNSRTRRLWSVGFDLKHDFQKLVPPCHRWYVLIISHLH